MNNNFTYTKKNVFENDKFGIEFPDEFELFKNYKQGSITVGTRTRDFIACYGNIVKNKLESGQDGAADIVILSGDETEMNETPFKKNQATKQIINEFIFWASGHQMYEQSSMYEKVSYNSANLKCGRTGYIHTLSGKTHNYHFAFGQKNKYKQIRVEINIDTPNFEDNDKLAIDLMNKYYFLEDLDEVKEPNDAQYISKNIDENIVNEWTDNLRDISANIDTYYGMIEKILECRKQIEANKMIAEIRESGYTSIFSNTSRLDEMLNDRCIKIFSDYLKEWFELCEYYMHCSEEFFDKAKEQNVSDNILLPAYKSLEMFISRNKEYFILTEDNKVESEYAKKLYKKLFDERILNLINGIDQSKSEFKNNYTQAREEQKQEIYDLLIEMAKPMTDSEIQSALQTELSHQKIFSLLSELVEENKVEKTVENNKVFYTIK